MVVANRTVGRGRRAGRARRRRRRSRWTTGRAALGRRRRAAHLHRRRARCCSSATTIAAVMAARGGRPLLVVDIAVPRDVDPPSAALPGVTLLDLDDLRAFAERRPRPSADARPSQVRVHRRRRGRSATVDVPTARQVAPLVGRAPRAGRGGCAEPSSTATAAASTASSEREREAVEAPHPRRRRQAAPRARRCACKDAAGTPRGERNAEALRDLFDLS